MKKAFLITLILALISTTAFAMPTDYIAAWDFETTTGANATDLSGNGYHGVINKPDYMTISAGVGIQGSKGLNVPLNTTVNDIQMNVPNLGRFIATKSAMSLSGWFKYNGTFDKERYFFNVPNTAGFAGFAASILTDGKVKLQIRNGAGSLQSITTDAPIVVGAGDWIHYTFAVALPEITDGQGTLIIYVNGAEVKKSTTINVAGMTTFTSLGMATGDNDFRIGAQGSTTFMGVSDDIKVFDRVITSAEAQQLASLAVATKLNKLQLANINLLELDGIKVTSAEDEGAAIYSSSFPIGPLNFEFAKNSVQRDLKISVNNQVVEPENYNNIQLDINDALVLEYQGDTWEGDTTHYYKAVARAEGIVFANLGFYDGAVRLNTLKEGTLTAKASVSSSFQEANDVIMLVIKRNSQSKQITGVSTNRISVDSSETKEISVNLTIAKNENCNLEMYLIDNSFKAYTEILTLQGE